MSSDCSSSASASPRESWRRPASRTARRENSPGGVGVAGGQAHPAGGQQRLDLADGGGLVEGPLDQSLGLVDVVDDQGAGQAGQVAGTATWALPVRSAIEIASR